MKDPMSAEPHPFARIAPSPNGGEAAVVLGWRESDGTEQAVFRLTLKSALRALLDELDIGLILLPSGIVSLDPAALPEGEFARLLKDGCLPQATLADLVGAMLRQIADAPDASDGEDLRRLAQQLEQAANEVRQLLVETKVAK